MAGLAMAVLAAGLWGLAGLSTAAPSLLANGDMEAGTTSWSCSQCSLSLSSDAHSGQHSISVHDRKQYWSGPAQTVHLVPGRKMFFRGYVKLLNKAAAVLYHDVIVMMDMGGHYTQVSVTPHIQPGVWSEIGADFTVPNQNNGTARVYLQLHGEEVNYLVDDVVLEEVTSLGKVKDATDPSIDLHRKQDIFIHLTGHVPDGGLSLELTQSSSSFPLGTAVNARDIVNSTKKAYQDFFYNNFNWAVLENALKWSQMEPTKGHIDYNTPDKAVNALRAHGIKVRGDNVFWGGMYVAPTWVQHLSPSDLRKAMQTRVQGVVGHFKGKLEHWDVNNENIHLDWYEQRLQDANITEWMFRETHRVDPQAKLFLNDNEVVNAGTYTSALVNEAVTMKQAGVPIYGIGVQCHFGGVDTDFIKHRLDELARTGLPLWVTELRVDAAGQTQRAQDFEDLLRVLFSHPSVEGILLWNFWNQAMQQPSAAIAMGDSAVPNEAGRRFQALFQKEWRTHVTQPLHQGQSHVRGFKGDYSIKILFNGHVIQQEKFSLGDSPLHLNVPVTGSGSQVHIPQIIVG